MAVPNDHDSSRIASTASRVEISDDNRNQSDRLSNRILGIFRSITVEPALFLYMVSSFLQFPVFQALIYEKACLNIHDGNFELCTNDTATHRDPTIQSEAALVLTLSDVCSGIPSFIATVFIGSFGDRRSRKIAILLPYVGLALADISYVVQATYMNSSVYLLLISDGLFGVFGGYSSIIGTSFSYGAQTTTTTNRSYRMAVLEGCIGVGGTIGYLFSGIILDAVGYRAVFLINMALHCLCFIYICLKTTDSVEQIERRRRQRAQKCVPGESDGAASSVVDTASNVNGDSISDDQDGGGRCWWLWTYLKDAISVLRRRSGDKRLIIVTILVAFSVSYLVFSGSQRIMFYYLKLELNWSAATYGIFRGVYYGSTSAMILTLFPLLKYRGVSDWILAAIGLASRLIGSLMLCFPFSTWFVFCVSAFYMFNRFAATGMRSIASKQVEKDEQGKLFAAIALIEAVCSLMASVIFNNLYSWSLSFYAGFCYALMAVLMIIPLLLIGFVGRRLRRSDNVSLQSSAGLEETFQESSSSGN